MSQDEHTPDNLEELVIKLTDHYTQIVSTAQLKEHPTLYWGGNGVGDRWVNKKFNYSVIYGGNRGAKTYSENDHEDIPNEQLVDFIQRNKGVGIIGIFVHSKRTHVVTRPIHKKIHQQITALPCVVCGTRKTICDHKNDLYNDLRVLDTETQQLDDFQPLCEHCNLQKRQVCKTEHETGRIYSAKNIQRYRVYDFEFPWEKKVFDEKDLACKNNTYWFDPVEFDKKIYYYTSYLLPVIRELKRKSIP
jgi:hypothetical protein